MCLLPKPLHNIPLAQTQLKQRVVLSTVGDDRREHTHTRTLGQRYGARYVYSWAYTPGVLFFFAGIMDHVKGTLTAPVRAGACAYTAAYDKASAYSRKKSLEDNKSLHRSAPQHSFEQAASVFTDLAWYEEHAAAFDSERKIIGASSASVEVPVNLLETNELVHVVRFVVGSGKVAGLEVEFTNGKVRRAGKRLKDSRKHHDVMLWTLDTANPLEGELLIGAGMGGRRVGWMQLCGGTVVGEQTSRPPHRFNVDGRFLTGFQVVETAEDLLGIGPIVTKKVKQANLSNVEYPTLQMGGLPTALKGQTLRTQSLTNASSTTQTHSLEVWCGVTVRMGLGMAVGVGVGVSVSVVNGLTLGLGR